MIVLERIATLDVSAASGLAIVGDQLAVIADDELSLSRYDRAGRPCGRVRLFAGELPAEPVPRKCAKPDLETLVALPDQRLLALGSGSTRLRDRAAAIDGDAVLEVDLRPLYDALRDRLDRLNVEGATVLGPELLLLTRRTGRTGTNALVRLDLSQVMAALAREHPRIEPSALLDVLEVELGDLGGTPLGFTDAAAWRGGVLYAAAAEATDDPVADGACAGCELGWIDAGGSVRWREPLTAPGKVEGIAIEADDLLWAVADADDRGVAAPLLRGRIAPR